MPRHARFSFVDRVHEPGEEVRHYGPSLGCSGEILYLIRIVVAIEKQHFTRRSVDAQLVVARHKGSHLQIRIVGKRVGVVFDQRPLALRCGAIHQDRL